MELRDLVGILLPGGPGFVDAVRRAWDDGDAVLPLDPDAPPSHLSALIEALEPTVLVDDAGRTRRAGRPVDAGDAVVVASSGTTGTPKGAVHTMAGIEHAAFATALGSRTDPDARWLACLPLSHVGGFSVITRALFTGAGLEVHPRFDAAAVDDACRRGATHVSLVPTALARIDPSGWRTILLGGSAIPTDRPPNTIATYGMTETFGGVVYDGLALGGTQVRIVAQDGPPTQLAPGLSGRIQLRSPSLLRCYRDGTDPYSDGWFPTGDLGLVDPVDRRLVVLGRADDLIITGGEKVWPGPVEDVLRTDPRVGDVAVVGHPDPEWGERVVAYVVPADGHPPELAELRDVVRARLPVAAAPKELRIVDSLPRTRLGKIRRSSLTCGDLGDA